MADSAANQCVDLRLLVVLLWREGELRSQPKEAGVLPLPEKTPVQRLENVEPALIHTDYACLRCRRHERRIAEPSGKVIAGNSAHDVEIAVSLHLAITRVVWEDHVIKEGRPRPRGEQRTSAGITSGSTEGGHERDIVRTNHGVIAAAVRAKC